VNCSQKRCGGGWFIGGGRSVDAAPVAGPWAPPQFSRRGAVAGCRCAWTLLPATAPHSWRSGRSVHSQQAGGCSPASRCSLSRLGWRLRRRNRFSKQSIGQAGAVAGGQVQAFWCPIPRPNWPRPLATGQARRSVRLLAIRRSPSIPGPRGRGLSFQPSSSASARRVGDRRTTAAAAWARAGAAPLQHQAADQDVAVEAAIGPQPEQEPAVGPGHGARFSPRRCRPAVSGRR